MFYAASLERPERHDFESCAGSPHPTGGWPVGYDVFQPYYAAAEQLYHVCGEPDPLGAQPPAPLRPPAPMPSGDADADGGLPAPGACTPTACTSG